MKHEELKADFSALMISIASSAAFSLGLTPHPDDQKIHIDLKVARFHIDLLLVLQEKTKNNLSTEEKRFLESLVADLQMKYLEIQKK